MRLRGSGNSPRPLRSPTKSWAPVRDLSKLGSRATRSAHFARHCERSEDYSKNPSLGEASISEVPARAWTAGLQVSGPGKRPALYFATRSLHP